MNILRTIRNNWKKCTFAAAVSAYGLNELKTSIEISQYMRELSTNITNSSDISGSAAKSVLVVLNPVANKKKAEKTFKKYCEPILHLAGYSVEILRTNHIGHAKSYVEEISTLPDVIVVAGGDGTTSEVVTGLMRRQGHLCPITLLPLGRVSQSASKYYDITGKSELEYVKTISSALMPLLKNKLKNESVIQYDVLNEEDDNHLKPIFGLNRFSWGLLKDIDAAKDKYWYFGPLRHYMSAFFKSLSRDSNWNFETDYVYTPPCAGCSNCSTPQRSNGTNAATGGFFLSKLVTQKATTEKSFKELVKNDSCSNKVEGKMEANQLIISCNENSDNFTELESKFINSLQPGWDFIKNIPSITKSAIEPNVVVKSRTIELHPAGPNSNVFYSIDGEEYDPRPIRVSVIPNAIKVFC